MIIYGLVDIYMSVSHVIIYCLVEDIYIYMSVSHVIIYIFITLGGGIYV